MFRTLNFQHRTPQDTWEISIAEALDAHQYSDVLRLLDEQGEQSLGTTSWELIEKAFYAVDNYKLMESERQERLEKNYVLPAVEEIGSEQIIDEMLHKLTSNITPKELIMICLTAIRKIKTTYMFERIARLVTELLNTALKPNLARILGALEILSGTLKTLSPPQEEQLDNAEERILMDTNKKARTINERYRVVADFLEDNLRFVKKDYRDILRGTNALKVGSYIVTPMESTLGLLDLCPPKKPTSSPSAQHSLAIRLKNDLNSIVDPIALLRLSKRVNERRTEHDELAVPFISGAVFCYIVFCLDSDFPRVYSVSVLADLLLTFSLALTTSPKHMHVLKGLYLIKAALPYIENCAEHDEIRLTIRRLLRSFLQVITTCSLTEAREYALSCWRELYSKCLPDFQLEIVKSLFKSFEDSSIRAFLIDEWRKLVHTTSNFADHQELIYTAAFLPGGVETDLLKHSDHIISTLNVIRYSLYSKSLAKTHHLDKYLTDLRQALDMSRAHYKLQLAAPPSDRRHLIQFPNIPREMEEDMLNQALTRFDLIEFVLAEVNANYDFK